MTAAHPAPENHLRRHMLVAIPVGLISALLTLSGGYLKDRIGQEATETASTVRIENLERRQVDIERAVSALATKEELRDGVNGLNQRLDDMRAMLVEIRSSRRQ